MKPIKNQSRPQLSLVDGCIPVTAWCRIAVSCFGTTIAVLIIMVIAAATASAAQFIPLGFLPGDIRSQARGISDDASVIAGTSLGEGTMPHIEAVRWTEATCMVGLGVLPGYTGSYAGQQPSGIISGDGSTIVGLSYRANEAEAFVHIPTAGMRGLGGLTPPTPDGFYSVGTCASFDGSVVAGYGANAAGNYEAFRWTEATGIVGLGHLLFANFSIALDMSADGSIIVGASGGGGLEQAVVWRAATGAQALGVAGTAVSISSDGKVIGGSGLVSSATNLEAFRWDEEIGVVGLGWLPGTSRSGVAGISADGSIIVGASLNQSTFEPSAYIWTADSGMQDLQQLLIDEYGLGTSLAGWNLQYPQGISANGQFIIGYGYDPNGVEEGWLVRLDAPPLAGDFNHNGTVDAADYIVLRNGLGTTRTQADYNLWRANFGRTVAAVPGAASFASVPEPTSALLLLGTLLLVASRRSIQLGTIGSLAILVIVLAITAATARAAQFIPLGFLPGGSSSRARGISDDGSVIAGQDIGGAIYNRAFRWTEATGMVDLGALPGYIQSYPAGPQPGGAISGDGSTIVGSSVGGGNGRDAFIYSEPGGMRSLGGLIPSTAEGFDSVAACASFDGSVVAGYATNSVGYLEAFRWTEATGVVGLGALLGDTGSHAFDISADGSTIVGSSSGPVKVEAVVWRTGTGIKALGVLGAAQAISSDGKVIGGGGRVSSATNSEAFRWDEKTGVVGLGWLPGATSSSVLGINADGSVIVGHSGGISGPGFIWTADAGMQDLQQLLIDEYGLGPSLAGWNLWAPQDISANGQFIVGIGRNPNGVDEAWLVRLDAPLLAGDFNHNGTVDAADYVVWRNGLGTTRTQADYDLWRANFGRTVAAGSSAASFVSVPEPTSIVLLICVLLLVASQRSIQLGRSMSGFEAMFVIVAPAFLMCSRSAEASQFYRLPYGRVDHVSAGGLAAIGSFADGQGIWYPRTSGITLLPGTAELRSISGDGTIVTGYTFNSTTNLSTAFRWTQATGVVPLPGQAGYESANAVVSADGSVIFGNLLKLDDQSLHLARWTDGSGLTILEQPAEYRAVAVRPVSADGQAFAANLEPESGPKVPGLWTSATGIVSLGTLPGWQGGESLDLSADGSTVVGNVNNGAASEQAFRWTNETGLVGLGYLPGLSRSFATAVSSDGQLVVGTARDAAFSSSRQMFAWSETTGLVNLTDILAAELGDQVRGNLIPRDISADNRSLVGYALEVDAGGAIVNEWPWAVVLDQPLQDLLESMTALDGDFNVDGQVDAADYVVWRNGLGTTHTQADYNLWRANFGRTVAAGSSAASFVSVPEPTSAVLLLATLLLVASRRREAT